MAATLREFLVEVEVQADIGELIAFENRLNSLDKSLTKASFAFRSIALNIAGMSAAMAGSEVVMAGVAAAGAGLTGVVSHMVTQTARQARTTEVATDRLQKMRFALQSHNIKAEKAVDVFSSLSEWQQEVAAGTKSDTQALQKLGLAQEEVAGLEPWQLYEKVANAAKTSNDQVEAATAVQTIFGEALGSKVMPLLEKGSSGFRKMGQNMEDLGAILGPQAISKFEELHQVGFQLWTILRGMARTLAKFLLPSLLDIAKELKKSFQRNIDDVRESLKSWARVIIEAFEETERTIKQIRAGIKEMGGMRNILNGIADTIGTITTALLSAFAMSTITTIQSMASTVGALSIEFIGLAASAWGAETGIAATSLSLKGLQSALVSTLIGLPALALAAAALVLIFEDIWTYLEGGKSITGGFVRAARNSEALQSSWESLKESVKGLRDRLFGLLEAVGFTNAGMSDLVRLAVVVASTVIGSFAAIGNIFSGLLGLFNSLVETLKAIFLWSRAAVKALMGLEAQAAKDFLAGNKAAARGGEEASEGIMSLVSGVANASLPGTILRGAGALQEQTNKKKQVFGGRQNVRPPTQTMIPQVQRGRGGDAIVQVNQENQIRQKPGESQEEFIRRIEETWKQNIAPEVARKIKEASAGKR